MGDKLFNICSQKVFNAIKVRSTFTLALEASVKQRVTNVTVISQDYKPQNKGQHGFESKSNSFYEIDPIMTLHILKEFGFGKKIIGSIIEEEAQSLVVEDFLIKYGGDNGAKSH